MVFGRNEGVVWGTEAEELILAEDDLVHVVSSPVET